eukprot:jgi/Picsp_1/3153/NSC_05993-R1_probable exonuclease mut-7 homolog
MRGGEEKFFKEGDGAQLGALPSSSRPKFVLVEDSVSFDEVEPIVTERSVVVGMDAEWPPDMTVCGRPCATVLQLACLCYKDEDGNGECTAKDGGHCVFERVVILFDLLKMLQDGDENGSKLKRMFKILLKHDRCLKIGHSLDMDIRAVSVALDCETVAVHGAVNVTSLFSRLWHVGLWTRAMQPSACKSLNSVMSMVFDVCLDKSYQCSAWGERPLSRGQLVYAANDAACLLDLFLVANCALHGVDMDHTSVKRQCMDGTYSIDNLPDGVLSISVTKSNLLHSIEQFGQAWSWKYGRLHTEKSSDFWTRKPSTYPDVKYPSMFPGYSTEQEVRSRGPRFICDVMLYGLSRQLRLWGIDCESLPTLSKFQRHLSHRKLVEQAEEEQRVILTKDTIFYDRRLSDQVYFVHSDTKQNQLNEVVHAFHIPVERDALLSRCPYCNSDFDPDPVPPERLPKEHEVPDGVLEKVKEFWVCSGCRKAYWRGSQYNRAMERLNAAFTGLQVDKSNI